MLTKGEKGKGIKLAVLVLGALLAVLCSPGFSHAQIIYTSVSSGNWGSSSTWSPAGTPTAADVVVIGGGHSVTVNVNNAVCAALEIGNQEKGTATLSFTQNSQLTVSGTVDIGWQGNPLRQGAIEMAQGGKLVCSGFNVKNFGSWTPGRGSLEITGTTTIPEEFTDFATLVINGPTVTFTNYITISDTLRLKSGTLEADTFLFMGTGSTLKRNAGAMSGELRGTNAYDLLYLGASKLTGSEAAGAGLRHFTSSLNTGATLTLAQSEAIEDFAINSGTVNTGTYTLTSSGNVVLNGTLGGFGNLIFNGSGKTISGTGTINSTGTLTISNGSKTILSGSNLTINCPVIISGGISVMNYGTVTSTSASGIAGTVIGSTWQNEPNSSLTISGPLLTTGNLVTLFSGNTVKYNGTSAGQTIKAATYHHLVIEKSSQTATLGGNITVNGNLTIASGTLDAGTANFGISVKGNFTNNGTFTRRSGNVTFSGSAAQTIGGSAVPDFFNLSIANTSGGVTISAGNATVHGALNFSSGILFTGSNTLIIAQGGSVSGAGAGKFVDGNLQKSLQNGSSVAVTYEIGKTGQYTPLSLSFPLVSSAGTLTAKVTSGDHPQIASSCINSIRSVNRYWTISNGGVAPANFNATFTFTSGSMDAGSATSNFKAEIYNGATWLTPTVLTRTATSITVSGLTVFADYQVGENNPGISRPPANVTLCPGNTALFSVEATGSGLSYQWQQNTGFTWSNISNGGNYSGAAADTLRIANVTTGMSGYKYRCIVTGSCSNTAVSAEATLTTSSSFSITTQPSNKAACIGSGITFKMAATGSVSGYQWQVSTNGGSSWANVSNGTDYSGATLDSLTLMAVSSAMDGYNYRCIVTSNCGPNDTTSSATLAIQTPPNISTNPSSQTICEAGNTNFSVAASGTNLTYQWQVSTNSGSTWSNLSNGGVYSGATTTTLSLTAATASMDGYQFRCVVSGTCSPPVTSTAATLSLNLLPQVTSHPVDVVIRWNTMRSASFAVAATGSGSLSYRWQVNDGTGWSNISDNITYSGSATTQLNLNNAALSMDGNLYRCVVSGLCSPADTSGAAWLGISFHFSIDVNTTWSQLSPPPTSTSTVEVRGGATLTVDVSDAVAASVQLGRKPNPSGGNGTIVFNSGAKLQLSGPGRNVILGDQNRSGYIDMTAGGTLVCNGFQINSFGGWIPGAGTLEITGLHTLPSEFATFNNLRIGNSITTLGANTTVSGSLYIDTFATLNTLTRTLNVGGNFTVNGSLGGSSAINLTGSGTTIGGIGDINSAGTVNITGNKTIPANTRLNFGGTVAIAATTTVTNHGRITSSATGGITGAAVSSAWVNAANSYLKLRGSLLVTGTLTASDTNNTVVYYGTTSSLAVKPAVYYNLVIDKYSQTATINAATTVKDTLTLTLGTFSTGTHLTMGANSVIVVSAGDITGSLQGANLYDVRYVMNSKCTGAELSGSGLRNVVIDLNIGETMTLCAPLTLSGNLTIDEGLLNVSLNNYQISIGGDLINNSDFVAQSGTVNFTGTGQTAGGTSPTTVYNVTSSNPLSLTNDLHIEGTLDLSGGTISTGENKVVVEVGGSIINADSTHFIDGKLEKKFTSGSNVTGFYEVGTGSTYLPVSLTFPTLNEDGSVCVKAMAGDHPQIGSSCLDPLRSVNFYWTLVDSSISPINYSAHLNYPASAKDTGVNTTNFRIAVKDGGWVNPNIGTLTSTSTEATGLTAFGDLQIAEPKPTQITSQPGDTVTCTGSAASFTVAATGFDLAYQWQESSDGLTWNNLFFSPTYAGTDEKTLQISQAADSLNGRYYRVKISAPCVPAQFADSVRLTVNTLPEITAGPTNAETCAGSDTSFSLLATGTDSVFQWQADTGSGWFNVADGGNYSGSTTATLNIIGPDTGMNGNLYRCLVGGYCSPTDTSAAVSLTVNTLPAISSHPVNAALCEGGDTAFAITADATGIQYKWQVSSDAGANWGDLSDGSGYSGATAAALSLTSVDASQDSFLYRCIVSGTCDPADTSTAAMLTVNTSPLITLEPVADTACADGFVNFFVNATGAALAYQWQESSNSGSSWSDLSDDSTYSGTASDTLKISGISTSMDNYMYRVVIAGTCSPADTSAEAALSIIQAPQVTSQPVNDTLCSGNNSTFGISASGDSLTYQWQENTGSGWQNLSDDTTYSGASTLTLTIVSATFGMSGNEYRCIVNNSCSTPDTSISGTLIVNRAGYWLGTLSSDWHTASNWCGGIPSSSTDVAIDSLAPNMPATATSVTVNKLSIGSGASLTMGDNIFVNDSLSAAGTLAIQGNVLALGGAFSFTGNVSTASGTELNISGNGNGTLPALELENFTLNSTGTVAMSGELTINGTLTLASGTLDIAGYTLTLNGSPISGTSTNLLADSLSSIVIGGSNSNHVLPASVTALKNFTINNTSGNDVGITEDLVIHDSLNLINGRLSIDEKNLTIKPNAVLTGYNSSKYIVTKDSAAVGGFLYMTVPANNQYVQFPVGTKKGFSPLEIKLSNTSQTDVMRVRVFDAVYEEGTTGTPITENVVNKTWLVDEMVPGGTEAAIQAGWKTTDEAQNFNSQKAGIGHYVNGKWDYSGSWGSCTSNGCRWRGRDGFTNFSPFAVFDSAVKHIVEIEISAILEGPYDTINDVMKTDLNSKGLLPLSQPFNTAPWHYSGNESVTSLPANAVDWVLIELRKSDTSSTADSSKRAHRKAGFILTDGSIVDADGNNLNLRIQGIPKYYVVVQSRNHLPVMAAVSLKYNNNNRNFDLRSSDSSAYGNNAVKHLKSGRVGMFAGKVDDVVRDIIELGDKMEAWDRKNEAGYFRADVNMDGLVDASDRTIILNNLNNQTPVP